MVWERDLLRYLLLLIMLMHAACLCMPLIEAASPMNVERWVWETMPDKRESKWLISLGILEIVKRESHLFSLSTVFWSLIFFKIQFNFKVYCFAGVFETYFSGSIISNPLPLIYPMQAVTREIISSKYTRR